MKTSVVIADGTFPCITAPLQGSYAKVCKEAAQIGFDAIQLTLADPNKANADEILNETGRHDLAISSIATGGMYAIDKLSMASSNEDARMSASDRMRRFIDLARQLGRPKVIIGTARGLASASGGPKIFKRQFTTTVLELLAHAEQAAVELILEANDRSEMDMYLSIKETAAYIREIGSPSFRLHIDSKHMQIEDADFYSDILRERDLITQVDISDENRVAPDGKHFDFPLLIRALREINYQQYLVFEYRPAPPMEAAKIGHDYIRRLISYS